MDLLLNFIWLCSDNSQLAFRDAIGPLVGLDLYLEQSASAYIAPGADYVKQSEIEFAPVQFIAPCVILILFQRQLHGSSITVMIFINFKLIISGIYSTNLSN